MEEGKLDPMKAKEMLHALSHLELPLTKEQAKEKLDVVKDFALAFDIDNVDHNEMLRRVCHVIQ
jgi:hypothetical protein